MSNIVSKKTKSDLKFVYSENNTISIIFSKNEEVKTFSGIPAIKFFGTLDYPVDDQGEKGRFNYSSYVFDFKSKSIILTILYEKDDRYALEIENRIINNLELIKEL